MKKGNKIDNSDGVDLSRRKAFRKLGLAASAVYAAPVLMTLSQSAHAASAPSTASTPSTPSAASGPSVSGPSTSGPSVSGPSTSSPSSPGVLSSPSSPTS